MERIIGIVADRRDAARCVFECMSAGVFKQEINLLTRQSEGDEIEPHSTRIFQKNGDVSTVGGSAVASGLIGAIIGLAIGVATFSAPGLGVYMGVGPLVSTICGATLGAFFGAGMGKWIDNFKRETSPLHRYILVLQAGEVLCSISVQPSLRSEIGKIVSKYAVTGVATSIPREIY